MQARMQGAGPGLLAQLGTDPRGTRVVVMTSRGQRRGGFDEFFPPDRIVEVDAPGLTSPILSRFDGTRLPRPVLPLDREANWETTWR